MMQCTRAAEVFWLLIRGRKQGYSLRRVDMEEMACKAADPDCFYHAAPAEVEITSETLTLPIISGELHGDPRSGETAHVHFKHLGCARVDDEDVGLNEPPERLVDVSCKKCGDWLAIVEWNNPR
jgi:hypothetical protein